MNVCFTYGIDADRIDVTLSACRAFIVNNEIRINGKANFNDIFGDVAYGQVKTLQIRFFEDNTTITLPEVRSRDYLFQIKTGGTLPLISINSPRLTSQRRHFVTYGDERFEKSVRRICKEALESNFFDTIVGLNRQNLSLEFRLRFANIFQMRRGGGYWIWKPFIIKQRLDGIEENDILVYCDSGCTVNKNGGEKYKELLDCVNNSTYGIVGFDLLVHLESRWTSEKIFEHFSIALDDTKLRQSSQLMASIIVLRKCQHTVMLVNRWLETVFASPLLFTDEYNNNKCAANFEDNRHDQSVFSILRKKYGCVLRPDDTFAGDWSTLADVPFLTTRIRE